MSPAPPALDVPAAAAELEGAPAAAVLRWARDEIPRFAVTSSFGTDSAVLLHLVSQVDAALPVLFLETGFHFAETLAYRHRLARRFGLTGIVDVRAALTVEQQAREHGAGLYLRDPDRCCGLRKVAPLEVALAGFDGWASGVRRGQTPDRTEVPVVAVASSGGRELIKVSPLAGWTAADVAAYRGAHDLPAHPMAQRGFASVGCAPCTRPVAPGEDARAGRWAGHVKTECGIHLQPPDESPPSSHQEGS